MPKKSTNMNLAQLLKEVSRHPALWQPHHADFNNRSRRAELWRDVAMRVVPNFGECKDKVKLVASVSRRWRYQQDNMLRCMRNNQPFQHEREMCFMVPILRARIAEQNGNERVRTLRRRTESTREALTAAHQGTVPPIRIVTRSHTTIGSHRLTAAKKPPTANATSTGAKLAAPTRYATTIATSGAATKKRKANPPQEAVISAAPATTNTETPATTNTETPATTTIETPATTTTVTPASATVSSGAASTMPLHQMSHHSPGPGEPSVAQGVIPPDQPIDSPVEVTNLITKEEFDDENPDLQLLATLDLPDLSIEESKDTESSPCPPTRIRLSLT